MPGILLDDYVEVRDQSEGSRLYTRGNYGYPRSGGGYRQFGRACGARY